MYEYRTAQRFMRLSFKEWMRGDRKRPPSSPLDQIDPGNPYCSLPHSAKLHQEAKPHRHGDGGHQKNVTSSQNKGEEIKRGSAPFLEVANGAVRLFV